MNRSLHAACAALAGASLFALAGCDSSNRSSVGSVRPTVGAIYVPTNAVDNSVVAYARRDDGTLQLLGEFATGGQGTGGRVVPTLDRLSVDALFSQDSAVVTPDRSLLFVVNAGDGSITSFRIQSDRTLARADREITNGQFPNTLATNGAGLLFVGNVNSPLTPLNPTGTTPSSVTGFRYDSQGNLTPIPGSTRELPPEGMPTQLLFDRSGSKLLVAQLFARQLHVFPIGADARLEEPRTAALEVDAFGLSLVQGDVLVSADVSPMGVAGGGSASSFALLADGSVVPITVAVANGKNAPCWTAVTPDGRFLYTSNTDDGDVSLFSITPNGELALVEARAASKDPVEGLTVMGMPTSGPVDSLVSPDGLFFYQQYAGRGSVVAYRIAGDGRLTEIGEFGQAELPPTGSQGIVGF